MLKTIPTSVMDYRKLKTLDFYVVDKSMMIKTFLDNKNDATLITRPRRFGKTLNMSMMAEFFDITKDSKEIFKDTKIAETKYLEHMNNYPTIFISFANAKGSKYKVVESIKIEIKKLYDNNKFIFDNVQNYDPYQYQDILSSLRYYKNRSLEDISYSLTFLMEQMERYYNKRVMLFIDEYDTPFIKAYFKGYYNEINEDLSSILNNALKVPSSLQYAMLTGIQRVSNENIFSDLNNFYVCTLKDQDYCEYFGFDEEETKTLLEYYGLELNEAVKAKYDGYHIGNINVYNPWSILHYEKEKN